ncbi:MAG TPA: hypothetical protein VHB51_01765 [Candidatus Saccharimonadales bacterium]|nr:hypothetical protein [Candidatus Saccharimonadales bacterium]
MRIFAKTINKTRSAILAGSTLALSIATPAAIASAHGFAAHGSGESPRMMSMQRFQQNCDQKQTSLNSQAAAIKAADQKRLNGQNILYSGIQDYVSNSGVTVANYDTLNSQVAADQAAATNDINNLNAPQLDCSGDTSAASTNHNALQSFEQAQKQTRQDLATYRHDLANLFSAVLNS